MSEVAQLGVVESGLEPGPLGSRVGLSPLYLLSFFGSNSEESQGRGSDRHLFSSDGDLRQALPLTLFRGPFTSTWHGGVPCGNRCGYRASERSSELPRSHGQDLNLDLKDCRALDNYPMRRW